MAHCTSLGFVSLVFLINIYMQILLKTRAASKWAYQNRCKGMDFGFILLHILRPAMLLPCVVPLSCFLELRPNFGHSPLQFTSS